jgi:arabinofuranosidase (fragment)
MSIVFDRFFYVFLLKNDWFSLEKCFVFTRENPYSRMQVYIFHNLEVFMDNKKKGMNPILPGFYPDPSICRVNDDYYLVTSTFAYFPGVPIFHSRDLVHWNQIGNILERKEQLPLVNAETSEGIFAPTLRYHDGTFYMITTNVTPTNDINNFIVTATDPAGPWSDPYPLDSAGIDPSLFFDDDGKCYYCGTQNRREGSRYFGDNEIYIQELDLNTMKLVGESYPAWHGALRGVEWPEGPHIYKKDGYYYLLISEAGTGHNHAVSIARSKSLTEPFTGHKANPIFTHRHLGYHYPIVNVGHPDIVETQNGEWWMVCLASRPRGGYYRNLGRETYLVPFIWEDGWPVINPGKGILEDTFPMPNLPAYEAKEIPAKEDFDTDTLPLHFMYLRNPKEENYSLTNHPGYLEMKLNADTLSSKGTPSYVCQRQLSFDFTAETKLSFSPAVENEQAGIAIYQSQSFNYQLLAGKKGDATVLSLVKTERDEVTVLKEEILDAFYPDLTLRITENEQDLTFAYSVDGKSEKILADKVDARILSTDVAGGFVGNTIGLYATSNGEESSTVSAFDYFLYEDDNK